MLKDEMEYTVLTCVYTMEPNKYKTPGSGPYSQAVTAMLAEGWKFWEDMRMNSHLHDGKIRVVLVQAFVRYPKQEGEGEENG